MSNNRGRSWTREGVFRPGLVLLSFNKAMMTMLSYNEFRTVHTLYRWALRAIKNRVNPHKNGQCIQQLCVQYSLCRKLLFCCHSIHFHVIPQANQQFQIAVPILKLFSSIKNGTNERMHRRFNTSFYKY